MARLYHTHDAVTSLVDFYGFQRRGGRTVDELEAHLRGEIGKVVGDGWDEQRVLPYVQMHEFEGLLFSDVSAFASLSEATTESVDALQAIRTPSFRVPSRSTTTQIRPLASALQAWCRSTTSVSMVPYWPR